MTAEIFDRDHTPFRLRPVSLEDIPQAAALCSQCVGENLYSPARIRQAMEAENEFFWVLKSQKGDLIGYLYYLLTDIETVASAAKVSPSLLASVCPQPSGTVCRLQAIGIREGYRGKALARQLLGFALAHIRSLSAQTVYAVCWQVGQKVPLAKPLEARGFTFLAQAHKVWYDEPHLYCPYCKGRCHCNAAIYYQSLE